MELTIKPVKSETVSPEPYQSVSFGCSNRAFYGVKSDLYAIGEAHGIEPQDGYMDESCDYEGDLDTITIYNCERGRDFLIAVCVAYGVDFTALGRMNLVLSIF